MSANYTYTNAEGDVQGRVIPLPAAADQTANLVLGYEKGPWSLRAAGSYRSGYLDELGGDAEEDRYVKDHFQIDLSAKYRLNKNIRIFGEIVNANDATYTAYNNIGGAQRLLQYEEYGFTTKLGFKINY
jgi:outer membrane receptor protein involved in Fe transport